MLLVSRRFWPECPFRNVVYLVLVSLFLSYFGISEAHAAEQKAGGALPDETKRYFSLMLLNLPQERGIDADLIPMAHEYGMNSVYLTIPWNNTVRTTVNGPRTWDKYDEEIAVARRLGMKIALRIHVGRNFAKIATFWDEANCHKDGLGRPLIAGYGDTSFSFADNPSLDKAADFVKEVLNRYKYLQEEGSLLFVSVTNTTEQEAGYSTLQVNEATVYDYSAQVTAGFRSWLTSNYKKIERLNRLWGGTAFKNFEEVGPPVNIWEPYRTFEGRRGKDWYIYRHILLKNYMDRMRAAVKSVDPSIKCIADFGSVFDDLSRLRGTLGFNDLTGKLDGVKINDDPLLSDHRWSVDIIKSSAPQGAFIANEVFYNSSLDPSVYPRQINENFEHGANMVAFLISTIDGMKSMEPIIRSASQRWSNTTLTPITYQDSVNYRLSAVVESPGIRPVMDEWRTKAFGNGGPRPVRVVLEEDLLHADYWRVVVNSPPYLVHPLAMRIVSVNTDFSYTLPTDTFGDLDGTITKMEPVNLPSWLRFDGVKISGKSSVKGDTRILVRATDDEGATADAYFTVRIDDPGNINEPPTVLRNVPDLVVVVDEPFSFRLPNRLFSDADGSITRIVASGMPSWLTFENSTFGGTPDSIANFRVSLTAYDNKNAFVETFFLVKVVSFQHMNKPPFLKNPLPIRYGMRNVPFSYHLTPDAFFGDEDGNIALISMESGPDWLHFNGSAFSGIPPEETEYKVVLRAYDNSGGFIDAPFSIRVERPSMRFDLVKAGAPIDRERVVTLTEGSVLPADSLPPFLTIFAYGNFEFDRIVMELKGPVHYKAVASTLPYSLFEGRQGFAPYIGYYTLHASALRKDTLIYSEQIGFSFSTGDSINIAKGIGEWQFYPNPFTGGVNVKLPEGAAAEQYQYNLVTARGQRVTVSDRVQIYSDLAQIDLSSLGLAAGIYFLEVEKEGKVIRRFKLVKI